MQSDNLEYNRRDAALSFSGVNGVATFRVRKRLTASGDTLMCALPCLATLVDYTVISRDTTAANVTIKGGATSMGVQAKGTANDTLATGAKTIVEAAKQQNARTLIYGNLSATATVDLDLEFSIDAQP